MIEEKTWSEFREAGLLWLVNTMLHLFGWAICLELDMDGKCETIKRVFPARVKFRGFSNETTTDGYRRVSHYLKENAAILANEADK